jgi:hypothetical protein
MIYGTKEKWDSFSAEETADTIARHEAFNKKFESPHNPQHRGWRPVSLRGYLAAIHGVIS